MAGLGYGKSIYIKRVDGVRYDNLEFWGQKFSGNEYIGRTGGGTEIKALITQSYSIYFNGVDSIASVTFDNDILLYVDNVINKYSENGTDLIVWQTGDAPVTGLFELDLDNRTLNIGYDGTDFKEHYQTHFILQYNNGSELITFLEYTFSEGLPGKTYDAIPAEIQGQYKNKQFPFNQLRSGVRLTSGLKL